MLFPKSKAKDAIVDGDLDALKQVLDKHPAVLEKKYRFGGGYSGSLLHFAAFCDRPEIIEFLVKEKHVDVNLSKDIAADWTPMHHAAKAKAYKAGLKLLELGADPSLADANGETTVDFVKEARETDPAYIEQKRQLQLAKEEERKKSVAAARLREQAEKLALIAGKWTLTGPSEVTHEHDLPDGSHRLKDIFNFQTRLWRAVVTDLKTNAIAQNIIFFDSMPDGAVLQEPLQKLKELGGSADESTLPSTTLPKKALKPSATP